jgi:dipeptidyl aminopeptidase/acylaminoacyl peptidase
MRPVSAVVAEGQWYSHERDHWLTGRVPVKWRVRASLPWASLAIGLYAAPVNGLQAVPRPAVTTSRITLSAPVLGRRHAVTLNDILDVREVHEPRLSPDGQSVAFLVRQAFLDCNCYHTALYVVPADGRVPPTKLVEDDAIADLRWTPDSRLVTYLSIRGGLRRLWQLSRDGGELRPVFTHIQDGERTAFRASPPSRNTPSVDIDQYEWSPDGSQIGFTIKPVGDSASIRRVTDGGVVYDEKRMWLLDILSHRWAREASQLWVYNVKSRRERMIWRAPLEGAVSWAATPGGSSGSIASFAWSPDGDRIAVSFSAGIMPATGEANYDLGLVKLAGDEFEPLVATDSVSEERPAWAPDGRRVAFFSSGDYYPASLGLRSAFGIVRLSTLEVRYVAQGATSGLVPRLWWLGDGTALAFETASAGGHHRERSGVYRVDLSSGTMQRLTPAKDHISDCGVPWEGHLSCVRQRPDVPNDPAIVDLSTGRSRTVAAVNPQLRDLMLAPVTELRWANKFAAETNGYLVRPQDYQRGKRYPLVLVLYHFEGRFVTTAEWLTGYPVQVLAREGFAVLLLNYPRSDGWEGNDFARGSILEGHSPLSSWEAAIRLLSGQGLVDTERVGIMGASHGGFWVHYALTHSSLFRVGSVTSDGDFNPGVYGLLGLRYGRMYEKILGGPPYGSTLANWLKFSPVFNADRVRAPVLIESSSDEAIYQLEMHTALRRNGVPVEFVIYPDDGHVLSQPRHRFASMQRNLDWFSFWLLERERPEPETQEQYNRWRAMRAQLCQLGWYASQR